MENKLEELKKENETIETKCKSTEETLSKYKDQTREILRKSKEKIIDTVKEKTELAEKLKNTEMELETLKESGSNQFSSQTPEKEATDAKQTPAKTPKRILKSGLQIEDLKVGNGPEAASRKIIGIYYKGKLKSNGKVFDSELHGRGPRGRPFKFRLGAGEVIKGLDAGIEGMKVGGKRRLTIPPDMAYGAKGALPDIPANSHLVFEVECKAVN